MVCSCSSARPSGDGPSLTYGTTLFVLRSQGGPHHLFEDVEDARAEMFEIQAHARAASIDQGSVRIASKQHSVP